MSAKLVSILKSAGIAAAGAAAAYILSAVQGGSIDLGVWGPLAAAAASWLVNLIKVWAEPAKESA